MPGSPAAPPARSARGVPSRRTVQEIPDRPEGFSVFSDPAPGAGFFNKKVLVFLRDRLLPVIEYTAPGKYDMRDLYPGTDRSSFMAGNLYLFSVKSLLFETSLFDDIPGGCG